MINQPGGGGGGGDGMINQIPVVVCFSGDSLPRPTYLTDDPGHVNK